MIRFSRNWRWQFRLLSIAVAMQSDRRSFNQGWRPWSKTNRMLMPAYGSYRIDGLSNGRSK